MASDKIPVLFDTDIGSDIDDALALAYLLSQPRCELVGITTVTGYPQVRAQLADAICQVHGRKEVPIHSGAGRPILVPQMQPEVPQKSILPKYPHREHFAPNMAVDFLRQTIRSRPGEITLLSVGPLTNLGLLFAVDPEIPSLLKQWVMMGGEYISRPPGYGIKEWNTMGDPHATAIAFGANAPGTRCYGLDVTTKCQLPIDECRKRLNGGRLQIVGDMAEVWFKGRPHITFHDPLAAAGVFEPGLCTYESGLVETELQSSRLIGYTDFRRDTKSKPHSVAVDVKPDAFFDHYFSVLKTSA
jgi:purine nucleosidase